MSARPDKRLVNDIRARAIELLWAWDPAGLGSRSSLAERTSDYDEVARGIAFRLAAGVSLSEVAEWIVTLFDRDWDVSVTDPEALERVATLDPSHMRRRPHSDDGFKQE